MKNSLGQSEKVSFLLIFKNVGQPKNFFVLSVFYFKIVFYF